MENASKALFIAISVLIAIMIISLILFGWKIIGTVEKTRDDVVAVKNKADFNAEFEVYRKNLMYGSDVLSCLNKAQDNNQRYVYNNYYGASLSNKTAREEYFVDVTVKLKTDLYDTVKAYYKSASGKYVQITGLTDITNFDDRVFNDNGKSDTFRNPDIYYYYFKDGKLYQEVKKYSAIMWKSGNTSTSLGTVLQSGLGGAGAGQIAVKMEKDIKYHLVESSDLTSGVGSTNGNAYLAALIGAMTLGEQTAVNSIQPSSVSRDDWWYCSWDTAAASFKKRKFRCTDFQYNEENGYIKLISFEEY